MAKSNRHADKDAVAQKSKFIRLKGSEVCHGGLDSEYRLVINPDGTKRNHILSMQIWGLSDGRTWESIKYVDDRRMTFKEVIVWFIESGMKERALRQRPKRIILSAHFSIADLSALADRDAVFRQLDYCKRTFVTFGDPIRVSYYDVHRNEHEVEVVLRDPWLMCPDGSRKLEALGEYIGVPKVDIDPYRIDEMDRLLRENPALFYRYAITDPKIAVLYTAKMIEFARDFLGWDEAPPTIGVCAVRLADKSWKEEKISPHHVLGTKLLKGSKGRSEVVPLPIREDFESFAVNAFAGGRNETFWFGPSPEGEFLDIDLAGAYSTGLACLGMPLWDQLKPASSVNDFTLDVIGFGLVKFRFPSGTRFPCLPVRVGADSAGDDEEVVTRAGTALIFPLEGECYATAPEIYLARQLGADLELRRGCVMPMDMSCRPFVAISSVVSRERAKHEKGSLMEKLVKTVGNCVFGKLAQAVRPKRVYSTRIMDMEEMKPSAITNPFLAAMTTGIIRAVLGEILAAVPTGRLVVSVTTDGFLSDVSESEIAALQTGPLCQMFRQARALIAENDTIVEIKHRARRVMSWRTRGLATLDYDDPKQLMLARAGIKTPEGSLESQNEFIVKRFLGRDYGDAFQQFRLRNARDLYEEGGDFVGEERVVHHRMDYDFKRMWITPHEREVDGIPHVCFDTKPLPNAAAYLWTRERWGEFYHRWLRPLKRLGDLTDFAEFAAVKESGKLQLPRSNAAVYVARKMFLIAYTHSKWGLECSLSNAQLAELLTQGGFPTSVREVENAKRPETPLYHHCVAATPAVAKFIEFVRNCFPTFEHGKLLAG